jgi:uncharacterized MAPEG superfamily protein
MTTMIICGLLLTMAQLWLIPASFNLKNLEYMLSSRDNPPLQSELQERVTRAGNNLQESLPAYLALCLLAMIQQVDLSQAAFVWLVLRVIYIPCYMFSIIYLRSLIWGASIASLVYMAVQLV